jgi:hypothetical protein
MREGYSGATLPSTTTQQSSGVLWRAASSMLYSFVSVGIYVPSRLLPVWLYQPNRIGGDKEAASILYMRGRGNDRRGLPRRKRL